MSKRPPINKKSGIALKQLINKMGFLSNAELARSTGIDKGSLSKLFNGQTGRPTVPNTLKIVNACAAKSDRALPEVLIEIFLDQCSNCFLQLHISYNYVFRSSDWAISRSLFT